MSNIFKQVNGGIAKFVTQPAISATLVIVARVLASSTFLIAGYGKLGAGYAATQGYMAAMGVPAALLPLVIALEIGGGLSLLLGFQTRLASFMLAIFCIATALIFHEGESQHIMFLKNFTMAGGLLAFTVFGGGRLSLDGETSAQTP